VRKCPYCDFNSHRAPEALPVEAYVRALLADLEQELPQVWGRPVSSIFFGGGTPSLFPGAAIGAILDGLATDAGYPSRGARYNSAIRYVASSSHACLAIVVSEDGMINVVAPGPAAQVAAAP
jgi:hypothetical protein